MQSRRDSGEIIFTQKENQTSTKNKLTKIIIKIFRMHVNYSVNIFTIILLSFRPVPPNNIVR